MQGLALAGKLQQSDFFHFADKIRINMGACSPQEQDSYAYRVFVLAHLSNAPADDGGDDAVMTECAASVIVPCRCVCARLLRGLDASIMCCKCLDCALETCRKMAGARA